MMKSLFATAGALALLAVLGRYGAQPLLAQVRAALVSDVDNPARGFVQFSRFVGPTSIVSALAWNQDLQYAVPAGRRLVIDNISAISFALRLNPVTTPFLLVIGYNPTECISGVNDGVAYDFATIGTRAAVAVPLLYNDQPWRLTPKFASHACKCLPGRPGRYMMFRAEGEPHNRVLRGKYTLNRPHP